jgi:transcriptional regulator with XRE-family HTH domain
MSAETSEVKALELLSAGFTQDEVASALGLTPGRISQIVANPEFSLKLAEKKFAALAKHNAADEDYDNIETTLREQLKRVLPLAMKPMEITRMLQAINGMKRRGTTAPQNTGLSRPVVALRINAAVVHRFAVNAANQVVEATAGEHTQSLVTIQSGGVQRLLNEQAKTLRPELPAHADSSDVIWKRGQGREKQDLLTECGFTVEIESSQASPNN